MDQFPQSFEHSALEAEIKQLALEVKRQEQTPEGKKLGAEALLKEAIKALPSMNATGNGAAADDPAQKGSLPDYAKTAPAGVKLEIEYLLDVAFHQGISKADAEARKSSAFVLDAFHDALAGKLYPEFQKRGLLK